MENFTKSITKSRTDIKGWSIDADPKNDPTYPMKKRTDEKHEGYNWKRPSQQPINIEVLHSNERPNVTAVFGTSAPPSGLSGMIRRVAFQYGEGSFAHWIPLILADRVNVVEGIIDDILHGHVPNIFAEKGMGAEWKYNKSGLIKKLAISTLFASAAIAILLKKKND